jgi:uncharacterized membrane protein YfcA
LSTTQLALVVISALIGGVMNSIAGGGTLLTFPALIALGVPAINANATSTVALWPGAVGSMWGYRGELTGARGWVIGLSLPSLLGGAVGALLLMWTPAERFAALVPWLVLAATVLFSIQRPVMRWFARHRTAESVDDAERTSGWLPPTILIYQFLMLAALGFMGLTNIHRMNGLKNWGGMCMNGVAAAMFAVSSLVSWPVALAMAVGAVSGGYLGSRTAQRVPQQLVRNAVVAIGLISGLLLFLTR